MTFMKDSESAITFLLLVLQPTELSVASTALTNWLTSTEQTPIWIPLSKSRGVTKVMPVLNSPHHYPVLLQSIRQQISQSNTVEWQGKSYQVIGVEVDTQALHILNIPLSVSLFTSPDQDSLTAKSIKPVKYIYNHLGRAIHALFFKWLSAADPILAEQIHSLNSLPVTLAIYPTYKGQHWKLRISLLQAELLAPLLWGLSQDLGGDVTLAHVPFRLGKEVKIEQNESFESFFNSYFENSFTLDQRNILPSNVIEMQFLSPTSFKKGQDIQPFPLPELVFGNLLRRWNAFAPVELQFPAVEWHGLCSAYELKTHTLKMEGGAEIGAVGWVRYRFPDPQQAAIATLLAHFAIFAGVGRKTGMGMGQARILNSFRKQD